MSKKKKKKMKIKKSLKVAGATTILIVAGGGMFLLGRAGIDTNGYLTIRQGYAWDGPSGPTFDTKNFMRGSLVHDALYQLMRRGYLNIDTNRNRADRLLKHICKEDGMSSLRAWWVYQGVHAFGKSAASKPRKQSTAP